MSRAGKARARGGPAWSWRDVKGTAPTKVTIDLEPADADRLQRMAEAAGLSPPACAASILAAVLADDAAAHAEALAPEPLVSEAGS